MTAAGERQTTATTKAGEQQKRLDPGGGGWRGESSQICPVRDVTRFPPPEQAAAGAWSWRSRRGSVAAIHVWTGYHSQARWIHHHHHRLSSVSTADCTDHRYIPRSPAAADALAAERDKRWEEASPPFFSD
ncbi:unnamed protein product [Arctogadus glacialis]